MSEKMKNLSSYIQLGTRNTAPAEQIVINEKAIIKNMQDRHKRIFGYLDSARFFLNAAYQGMPKDDNTGKTERLLQKGVEINDASRDLVELQNNLEIAGCGSVFLLNSLEILFDHVRHSSHGLVNEEMIDAINLTTTRYAQINVVLYALDEELIDEVASFTKNRLINNAEIIDAIIK